MSVTSEIKEKILALGYDACGVISVDDLKEYAEMLDRRVARFPHSRDLYEGLYWLAAPEKKWPWARSVIVAIRSYNQYKIPEEAAKYFGKVYLFDGRLKGSREYEAGAAFQDYLTRLGARFVPGSVPARWAAVKAGLGQFGKNNFLYTRNGSWVWVDTWVVDLELEYDRADGQAKACPKDCTQCMDACPTGALCEPFAMDRGKCIVQLSIISAELPPESLWERMGTWMYGCDVCQDVCPKNKNRWKEQKEFGGLADLVEILSPAGLAEMDEATFLGRIQPRFWYIARENGWLWRANALRAMANSGDPAYRDRLREARTDGDERVRAVAHWACRKLGL